MDLKKNLETHGHAIERLLIALIFLTVLLSLFIDPIGQHSGIILVCLQLALVILYCLQIQNKAYLGIWVLLVLGITSIWYVSSLPVQLYYIANQSGYIVFGLLILVKAIRWSMAHKNFEMLTFIMGFILVLQSMIPFFYLIPGFAVNKTVIPYFAFAAGFSIGTVIYNDNLWHRFTEDEKNLLKFILIVELVMVVTYSLSSINFE